MNTQHIEACEPIKPERDVLVEKSLHLVKIIAHQVAMNLPPHIEVDDLISAGTVGLLEAIDRFDKSKGVQFNTYASIRVRGAIMDELRSLDWMTRSMRDKSNQLERAYHEIERKTGRPAETDEVADYLDISTDSLYSILREVGSLRVLNLEDLGVKNGEDSLDILECIKDPDGIDPMVASKFNELKRKVAEAVESLPDKEKIIVSLYYYDELTLKEIGKVLGITESRVCQLHGQTMQRLKVRLKRNIGLHSAHIA